MIIAKSTMRLTTDRGHIHVPGTSETRSFARAMTLLQGSRALANLVHGITLKFPATHGQKAGTEHRQLTCAYEKKHAPTTQLLALLPNLESLSIKFLNAMSPQAQLTIADMLQTFSSAAIALTDLDLASCNMQSKQVCN